MIMDESLLKNRLTPFLLAVSLTLVVSVFWAEPLSNIESAVGDHLWQLMGTSVNRERRVVVIDIDEASIARYGAWPWPRERTAALFRGLTEQGVALRVVDIAFPDSKPGDDELAAELLKTPTVLAQVLAIGADEAVNMGRLQGAISSGVCPGQFPVANGAIGNAPNLKSSGAGHITPRVAADGTIRYLPAIICYQDKGYAALALAAIAEGAGVAPEFSVVNGKRGLDPVAMLRHSRLPGFSVPINEKGDILLPWWTSRESITSISAKDIMEGNVPAGYLKGAWVLLGATAFGMGDTVPTPQAAAVSGVEVHAQLMTALLDGRIPYQPRGAMWWQMGWIALSTLLLLAVTHFRGGIIRVYGPVLTGLLLIGVIAVLHAALLWFACLWLPWMSAVFFILLLITLLTTQGYLSSRVAGVLLYRNLSSYLPAHVARQIAQEEPGSTLNAHHEQVIVLYADLRNFSAWCDQLPAEQAGALLHSFYTFASKIIHQEGGVVEEYVGDAVMGVWRTNNSDLRPLNAAKSIVLTGERLFGAETGIDALPPLAIGIGIERGEVLVGSFGPARRRVHALLGRTVTTAIHLQSMTGELSQPIVCGENVVKAWKDDVSMISLGNFLLKDRQQPTELFVPGAELAVESG
ncbi:CHASE2 domain-containing protein [Candidatus Methylobacter oryzae]|uniref:Adenylate/guanylate cyclase domain-containing protein n=1 Tax=Candidatus Methylobacter oryzae TaxID=2497749 RepID=A0ABY3C7K6_9GAMM|nr:adenylate/guanylate cyclase domain-containing protein [Candidatus Methylobacter oryzae]TRW92022.1 adenylate/guanylate cyclase domain-containing protein [Candidatus Methylobacter oryzae]